MWLLLFCITVSIEKVEKKTKPSDGQDGIKEPLEEQALSDKHANRPIPEEQAEQKTPENGNCDDVIKDKQEFTN